MAQDLIAMGRMGAVGVRPDGMYSVCYGAIDVPFCFVSVWDSVTHKIEGEVGNV